MRDQSQRAADYYAILGADPSASAEEIKTAYRRAVMKHHPDRCPTYVGYLFYPILGFPLVAAPAELVALLVYVWRVRRIAPETEALLKA
jgi:hypothetical protein